MSCPPWNYVDTSNGNCKCCSVGNLVKCTDEGGYCTTYKEGEGVFMGRSPYFKVQNHNISYYPKTYLS